MGELIGGLIVIAIGLCFVWLIYKGLVYLLLAPVRLGEWIFHSDAPLLGRVLAVPLWVPLALFRLTMIVIAILSAISLLNNFRDWWHQGK